VRKRDNSRRMERFRWWKVSGKEGEKEEIYRSDDDERELRQ